MLPFAEVQASPQSCWKNPRPMIPLAPRALTLLPSFGPVVWLEQLLGTGGETLLGIITCTGEEDAFSPASEMSADDTGPQTKPSRNTMHSSRGFPLESFCWGSEMVNTDDNKRSPEEPVSTST